MFPPVGTSKIYLHERAVDMRKSFEGLGGLVEAAFPGELLTGAVFIFINGRRDKIKLLYWDNDGFVIWYKRLEKGTFSKCFNGEARLDRRRFAMLLEGVVPKRLERRFELRPRPETGVT